MAAPISQNVFTTSNACKIIDKIQNKKVNANDVKSLQDLAGEINSKVAELLPSAASPNKPRNNEERQRLEIQLYPVALKANHALNSIKINDAILNVATQESLQKIIDAYTSLSKGAILPHNESTEKLIIDEEEIVLVNDRHSKSLIDEEVWLAANADSHKETALKVAYDSDLKTTVIPGKMVDEAISDEVVLKFISDKVKKQKEALAKVNPKAKAPTVTDVLANVTLSNPKGRASKKAHPVTREGSAAWHAIRYKKKGLEYIGKENQVTPTTHKKRETQKIPDDLTNMHYQLLDGQLCITCGVIDTIDKAEEVVALIKKVKGEEPVKVLICQLNSAFREPKFVADEHFAAQHMDRQLKTEGQGHAVSHLNHSLNVTSNLKSGYEDSISYYQNLLGLGILTDWVEMGGANLKNTLDLVDQLRSECRSLDKTIKGLTSPQQKAEFQKQLDSQTAELKKQEENLTKQLAEASVSLANRATRAEGKDKLIFSILSRLLGQETYKTYDPYLDRVTELELLMLLGTLLKDKNVIIIINCKSGIDRTGFVKATREAMHDLLEKYKVEELEVRGLTNQTANPQQLKEIETAAQEKLLNFILQIDQLTPELNKVVDRVIKQHTDKVASTANQYGTVQDGHEVFAAINAALADKPELQNLWFYQQRLSEALLAIGTPVSVESTNLRGLKYGHDKDKTWSFGAGANPHPFKRIAKLILTSDNKAVQVHDYTGGKIYLQPMSWMNWPTDLGKKIFLHNSTRRGD